MESDVQTDNRGYGAYPDPRQIWHLRPWWKFWRPKWQRWRPTNMHYDPEWEYQTHEQRARETLAAAFDPSMQSGVGMQAQGQRGRR